MNASLPIEISVRDVRQLQDAQQDVLLIDCRTPEEQQIASIEGTRLVPFGELADRVDELSGEKDRRIVVHCHGGGRSLRAAAWLRQQGFSKAQSMAGGIDAWSVEIDPQVPRY
jgi:adenylyltransferase/sulfurtransferase